MRSPRLAQWQLQEAKQKLSRVVDLAVSEGPQTITRHGNAVAILVSIEEYRRLREADRPTLKDVLLRNIGVAGEVDIDSYIPERGQLKGREPIDLAK